MLGLDPRTRIVLGVAGLAVVATACRLETAAIQAAMVLCAILVSGQVERWARSMRLLWPTMAMMMGVVYFSFDLSQALSATAKLFNLLAVSYLFFSGVSPEEMSDALRSLHVPYAFSFILTTAMRYVPLLGQKARSIMDAQMSRGIDLRFRLTNMNNIIALIFPLTAQSFMLSEQLAMAMEMRGFSRGRPALRRCRRLRPVDYLVMVASVGFLLVFVWWERFRLAG
jgi:energy-coupling factor transport system permease protein